MADLAKQSVVQSGLTPAFAAAAGGGDKLPSPTSRSWLVVKNGGGAPITVTVVTPRVDPRTGLAEADAVVSVTNAQERWIGPIHPEVYGDPADAGKAAVTYSAVTSVTVGYFEL